MDFWNNAFHEGVLMTDGISKISIEEAVSEVVDTLDTMVEAVDEMSEGNFDDAFEGMSGSSAASFDLSTVASGIKKSYQAKSTDTEFFLYQKSSLGTGNMANNPWLQEVPDPITKACWDNYAAVSQAFAEKNGLAQDDIVKLTISGVEYSLPVLVQPGMAKESIAIALGYGRSSTGKVADGVGVNLYTAVSTGDYSTYIGKVEGVSKSGETRKIAQTQTHHTYMGRSVIQESTLSEYKKDAGAGRVKPMIATSDGKKAPEDLSLWVKGTSKDREGYVAYKNHHWGMVIDLNSCTGCNACVVSCQAENNVPVVGRKEVINRREMHWIRIDRYYSSDATEGSEMENPSENPQVTFQPLMCQHCNNAPCETVCPVAATTHSSEGLNQMAYNRCFGTRYCANNCPYKVRRFNSFSYYSNEKFHDINPAQLDNTLGRMVLNPDVTVRARGVMEKCSLCVQRIQSGKLSAKREKRRPVDGEIKTACQQTCPTDAITFGDMNDPKSKISLALA